MAPHHVFIPAPSMRTSERAIRERVDEERLAAARAWWLHRTNPQHIRGYVCYHVDRHGKELFRPRCWGCEDIIRESRHYRDIAREGLAAA